MIKWFSLRNLPPSFYHLCVSDSSQLGLLWQWRPKVSHFFMNFLFQLLSASKYFMKNKKLLKALGKLLIKVSTSTEAFKVQVHKKSRTLKIQITTWQNSQSPPLQASKRKSVPRVLNLFNIRWNSPNKLRRQKHETRLDRKRICQNSTRKMKKNLMNFSLTQSQQNGEL